ncbi:MAG: type II toxin-antitoxin system MqsA family antitoxin [Actinomycetota bacterium]|nr:type II toxin-antitoxin system MqsA family antitoxin [Actinomycetota bacterium]
MTTSDAGLAVCSVCGQRAVEMTRDPIAIEFREGTWRIEPDFDYERCRACGEELYPGPGITDLTRRAIALARKELGFLTPDEVRGVRHALDLTQGDFERALGVSRGTMGRWERGEVFQSATADRLMRVLAECPDLIRCDALSFVARETRGPYRKQR